jgi:hypothetical protein
MSEYTRVVNQVQETLEVTAQQWKKTQDEIARTLREGPSRSDATIPSVGEIVGANYGLAVRMLELNQDLAMGWFRAVVPAAGEVGAARKSTTTS